MKHEQRKVDPPRETPRQVLEQTVLAAAAKAHPKPFTCATVLSDGAGRWIMAVFELTPDGRWREVSRTDPTGRQWAEGQLAEELHRQNMARAHAS